MTTPIISLPAHPSRRGWVGAAAMVLTIEQGATPRMRPIIHFATIGRGIRMAARTRDLLWLVSLLSVIPLASALAQDSSSTEKHQRLSGCPEATEYPCGAAMKVRPETALALLKALDGAPEASYARILEDYLGESYGRHFNDWVVYIGKNGKIKQALVVDGQFEKGSLIRGGQAVFAVVFSDALLKVTKPKGPRSAADSGNGSTPREKSPAEVTAEDIAVIAQRCAEQKVQCSLQVPQPVRPSGGGEPDTSATLELSRSTLQYTREAALTAFIKSITKSIVGDAGQTAAIPDSVVRFGLLDVIQHDGSLADTLQLFVGFKRLGLPNNALVRYTLRANQAGIKHDIPGATSLSRTVENASRNRFGASLGLGVTGNAPDSSFAISHDSADLLVKSRSSPWKPNAWVLAHFYITRPQLPISPTSVSVIAGTNIGISDLFRDLLIGISVDRVFGDVGVMGGLNFIERQSGVAEDSTGGVIRALGSRTYRKGKWFAGINFAL